MTTKDVLALALEALEKCIKALNGYTIPSLYGGRIPIDTDEIHKATEAITAIKQAQQAQEPVSDALIDQLFSVFQGWAGSTFGWQDSTSLDLAAANFERAKKAHEAECKRRLKEVFAAAPKQAEPEGYKLVPVEPTPEILAALWAYKADSLQDAYRAMLAAAPTPPEAK
jgi:hypothetical protein